MGKISIKKTDTGFKFDVQDDSGKKMMSSQEYRSLQSAQKGVSSILRNVPIAPVEDLTAEASDVLINPKFEVFKDQGDLFRFRLKAKNGQIVTTSDAYDTKAACEAVIAQLRKFSAKTAVEVIR